MCFSPPDKVDVVQAKFRDVVSAQNVDQSLKSFLRDHLQLAEGEKLTGVLKCLNTVRYLHDDEG